MDGQIYRYPVACISINTPFLTGTYVAAMFEDPVADVIIGNVDEARVTGSVNAVTRSMSNELEPIPTKQTGDNVLFKYKSNINVSSVFKSEQQNDPSLKPLWERLTSNSVDVKRKGLVSFIEKMAYFIDSFSFIISLI